MKIIEYWLGDKQSQGFDLEMPAGAQILYLYGWRMFALVDERQALVIRRFARYFPNDRLSDLPGKYIGAIVAVESSSSLSGFIFEL